jgi:hypothetical protein
MSYSDAGKGSKQRKTNKKQYDENYDLIFGRKEKYFDSDESNDWDQELADIITRNQNMENK